MKSYFYSYCSLFSSRLFLIFSFSYWTSYCLPSLKQRYMYLHIRLLHLSLSHLHLFCSFSLACFLACRDRSCFASSSPSFVDKSFSRCLTAFCLSEYCYYDIHRTIDDKWWELGSFVPTWCEISYAVRSIKIIIRVGEWQMSDRWWWWWSYARRDDRYTDMHVSIYACFMSSASRLIIIIIICRSSSSDDKSMAKFASLSQLSTFIIKMARFTIKGLLYQRCYHLW